MEIYVTTEWNNVHYRATYGKCSILDARRYYKHNRLMREWVEETVGVPLDKLSENEWESSDEEEEIYTAIETWMALAEIIAALKTFEKGTVQDEGDENREPLYRWDEEEVPVSWTRGDTAAEEMPYEFFEASLHAGRTLNPGLFPTSPDFLARNNLRIKGSV